MKALTDDDLMTFGEHKGKFMMEVPASYLHELWWEKQNDPLCPVVGYIRNNLKALQMENRDLIWE